MLTLLFFVFPVIALILLLFWKLTKTTFTSLLKCGWLNKKWSRSYCFYHHVFRRLSARWLQMLSSGNVRHGPSVSLKRCKSSSASFGCCFPRERHKSSPPSSEDTVPRDSPNIQGIKRHLACESIPLMPALRAVFYFPFPHLLLSSLLLSTTNIQAHHFDFP